MDQRNEREANATLQAAADRAAAEHLATLRRTGQAAMPPRTSPIVRDMARGLAIVVAILLVAHVLAACGGGDPEPDQPTPGVNCALDPVVCK